MPPKKYYRDGMPTVSLSELNSLIRNGVTSYAANVTNIGFVTVSLDDELVIKIYHDEELYARCSIDALNILHPHMPYPVNNQLFFNQPKDQPLFEKVAIGEFKPIMGYPPIVGGASRLVEGAKWLYALMASAYAADRMIHVREGWREQQRRDRRSERETQSIIQKHRQSVQNNIGQPSPDGTPDHKNFGNKKAIVSGVIGLSFMLLNDFTTPEMIAKFLKKFLINDDESTKRPEQPDEKINNREHFDTIDK